MEDGEVEQPILAVDGTTLRRSYYKKSGQGPLHSVNIWATTLGLSLGQMATSELQYVADADSRKDAADLKQIYQAAAALQAEHELQNFAEKDTDSTPHVPDAKGVFCRAL